MKKFLTGLFILAILSCNQKSASNLIIQKVLTNQLDTLIFGKRLIIKDTSQYSPSFINELKKIYPAYETLKLIDDSLIVSYLANTKPDTIVYTLRTDRYSIPTNLELNKEIVFSANQEDKTFMLRLKRTNYTNIDYQLMQDGKTIKSGTAILQATFYFGAEVQNDEKGEQMFLNQYIDKKGFETYLKIEINSAERATFTYCPDEKTEKYETLPMFIRE